MQLETKPKCKEEESYGGRLGSDFVGLGLVLELVRDARRPGTPLPKRLLCRLSAQLCAKQAAACADEELANEG